MDSLIRYFYEETVSFLDYFPKEETLVFLDEPARLQEKAEGVAREFEESMKGRLEKGYIVPEPDGYSLFGKGIVPSAGKTSKSVIEYPGPEIRSACTDV